MSYGLPPAPTIDVVLLPERVLVSSRQSRPKMLFSVFNFYTRTATLSVLINSTLASPTTSPLFFRLSMLFWAPSGREQTIARSSFFGTTLYRACLFVHQKASAPHGFEFCTLTNEQKYLSRIYSFEDCFVWARFTSLKVSAPSNYPHPPEEEYQMFNLQYSRKAMTVSPTPMDVSQGRGPTRLQ